MTAGCDLLIRRFGLSHGAGPVHKDKAADPGIKGVDAGKKRPGQLTGGNFSFTQQPGGLCQAQCV
jgi:hypothetical protein